MGIDLIFPEVKPCIKFRDRMKSCCRRKQQKKKVETDTGKDASENSMEHL